MNRWEIQREDLSTRWEKYLRRTSIVFGNFLIKLHNESVYFLLTVPARKRILKPEVRLIKENLFHVICGINFLSEREA